MIQNSKSQPFCACPSYQARRREIRDPLFRNPQDLMERPSLKRPCSAEVVYTYEPDCSVPRHRSTSDLFDTRSEFVSNDELRWSRAPCDEGHIYTEVGMIFEDDYYFPPNVTFASRTHFKGACFFGAGSTFESRCVFEKTCFFGPSCVFDSSSIFKMPCVFNQACAFGKFCQTAQNSMFSTDCKLISAQASIIEITPKAETSGFKDDIIMKLERNPKCVSCKKRNKSHILQPCGHMVVCKQCSKKESISSPGTGRCPVCRQRVEKVQKVIIGL